jgi:hypothetical protein
MAQFDENNQPAKRRGKAFKTKLFEAVRAQSLLHVKPDSPIDEVEQVFIQNLALKAMGEDGDLVLLKDLMNKSYPPLKPTMDAFDFDLDPDSTPSEKAQQILVAVSNGQIPPDVGSLLINAAKAALDIEALTDIKLRLEALEKLYDAKSSETT